MSGTLAEFPSWEGSGVGSWKASSFFRMHCDHELPPHLPFGRRRSQCRGSLAEFPSWEGPGWVGSSSLIDWKILGTSTPATG